MIGMFVERCTNVPSRILVTGGAGFIGSNFVRWVLVHVPQVEIIVLDSLTYAADVNNLAGLPKTRLSFVQGDINDASLVDSLFSRVEAVVHFAAETHNDRAIQSPEIFVQTNIVGTFVLLQAARKWDVRFHHVSTDEVFGELDYLEKKIFRENSVYKPNSPYSSTKASADMLVRAWHRTYGVRATISNCSNNYGPHQHREKFIPYQITAILEGEKPRLYGSGNNIRDWIHVEDNARAIWTILCKGEIGETYLVGARCEQSNYEVLQMILEIMGRPQDEFCYTLDRPGHDRRYSVDPTKLESELGWRPVHVDFKKGLRETIEWYCANKAFWIE